MIANIKNDAFPVFKELYTYSTHRAVVFNAGSRGRIIFETNATFYVPCSLHSILFATPF